jgi:cell division transport system permease protein
VSKKKFDSKAFSQLKRRRRRVLTFVRMMRYGVNNFSRNAWLTVAATAVMTITLLIVFTTVTARQVLISTVSDF